MRLRQKLPSSTFTRRTQARIARRLATISSVKRFKKESLKGKFMRFRFIVLFLAAISCVQMPFNSFAATTNATFDEKAATAPGFKNIKQNETPEQQDKLLKELAPQKATPITSENISVNLVGQPLAQFAGFIISKEKGFYREAGLPDVTLNWLDYTTNSMAKLYSSNFQVEALSLALASLELAPGQKEESGVALALSGMKTSPDIVNIAQLFQRSDLVLVGRKSKNIKKITDVNGKNLQVLAGNGELSLPSILKTLNLLPKAIYPLDKSVMPFIHGTVDACVVSYYDGYNQLVQRGIKPEDIAVFRLSGLGAGFVEEGIYTTREYYEKNPEISNSFARATIKGYYYAFTHKEEAVKILLSYGDMQNAPSNKAHQLWMLEAVYDLFTYNTGKNPLNWGYLKEDDYNAAVNAIFPPSSPKRPSFSNFSKQLPQVSPQ